MKVIATRATDLIIAELSCRSGFDNVLDSLDEDTKNDLKEAIQRIIQKEIAESELMTRALF